MSDNTATRDLPWDDLMGRLADEFLERLRKGEKPDVETYAKNHPEVADMIREIFPSLEIMGETSLSATPNGLLGNDHRQGVLGDYRIVREIGRGGMGVVYEAEQISLDRRVALKVLPFASVLDERQVRRFRNEARAAAHLKHANIVQVFGVGCERGVHFYAMEYVEGESLSKVIADLRRIEGIDDNPVPEGSVAGSLASGQFEAARSSEDTSEHGADATPSPKASLSTEASTRSNKYFHSVARLAVQLAEALDHAHEEGVIHRDIKPSNLIIDAHGKAWVTDFGLARIETDAGMTMTGDLVGTMRYMSPEQALAKRVVVDQRTDTYSLGVTLYELLTLRPAFPHDQQQELLRAIAFEEPTRPRKLNPKLPQDLETIILKAMEKNPNDRYGSTQELADDLRRYLADEPILAKRPSALQIGRKWAKRHSTGVMFTVATLILVIATGFGMLAWKNRQYAGLLKQTLDLRYQNGLNLLKRGRYEEARGYLEDAYTLYSEGVPLSEEKAFQLHCDLGEVSGRTGDFQRAVQVLEPVAGQTPGRPGVTDNMLCRAKLLLAYANRRLERTPETIRLLTEILAIKDWSRARNQYITQDAMVQLAEAYSASGKHDDALRVITELYDFELKGGLHWGVWDAYLKVFVDVHNRAGRNDELQDKMHHAISTWAKTYGETAVTGFNAMKLLKLGRKDMAEPLLFKYFLLCLTNTGEVRLKAIAPLLDKHQDYYHEYEPEREEVPKYRGHMFNGKDSFAVVPTIHFDGTWPWTVEVIATTTVLPANDNSLFSLVSTANSGCFEFGRYKENWGWWLRDGEPSARPRSFGNYAIATSTSPICLNKRQHIAGVWGRNEIRNSLAV